MKSNAMVHLWSVVATALSIATLVRKAQSQCFTYEETSLSFAPTIFFDFEDTASQPFLDTLKGVEAVIEGAHLNGESLLANSGNALMFDGGHVMIQSISQQALIPASFSITFWAKPLFSPNYEHNQNMQIFSTVQGAGISIVCTVHNQWGFQVGNAEFSSMISGGFCATDHLSFVVASYDASAEEATLYINGESVASRFVQFPSYPSTQMLLGAGFEANGNSVFDGVLDGFAVYAQVLEENDIQLLYYSGFCPVPEKEHFDAYPQVYFEGDSEQGDSPDCYGNAARLLNPIILFDFQEVDTVIYDEIKNLPGELEGNFSVVASPVPNGGDAFYFNGIDADVYIEQTSYFNFFTTRSFSIVFWAKPTMQNVDESLVDIPVVSNKKNNLGLSIWCTSTFEWVFFIGAGTVLNAFQGGECSSGTLSLVVAAFDDNTQNAALYVNGDLVSSGMVDGGYSAADTPLYFGSGIEQDGSKGYFEGIMDGVTIFPRSLTPVEVETLAISGNCQGTPASSVALTPGPTLQPTPAPTPAPTMHPTPLSSTPAPTMHPTPEVFSTPEPTPSPTPSVQPTTAPTPTPSAQPTWQATPAPTLQPPQPTPTPAPSVKPTTNPTHTKRPTPKSGSTTPMPTAEPILGAFENPEAINFLLLNDAYKKGHDIYLNDLNVGSEGEAILNKKWVQHVGIPTSSVTLNFEMLIGCVNPFYFSCYVFKGIQNTNEAPIPVVFFVTRGTSPAETCSGSEMIWSYGADNNCMRRRAEFGNEEKCHGVDVGFIIGGSRDGVHIMKDGILERERNGTKLLFNTWMEVRIGLNFNGTHHFLIVAVEDEEYFQDAVLFTHEDLRDYDDLGKMGFFGSTGFIGTKVNLIMGTELSLNKMSGNKQAGNKAAGNDVPPAGGNDLPAAGCSPVEFAIRNVLFTNMTDYTTTVDISASSHSSKMENPNKAEIASLTFTNKMQQALPESTENTLLQFLEGLRDHITGFSMYGQLPFLLVMASFPTGYAGYQVLSSYFSSHQARQSYLPIPV